VPAAITVTGDGPIRTVTLNRPDVLNAVNAELHQGLTTVWRELAADEDARAVILTGAGRAFSAGGDFDYLQALIERPAFREQTIAEAQTILWEMVRFPLPLIAAINGPAVGLGCSLALACDIVLVSESAFFADPHVGIGLVCGDGGAALLPLVVPLLRAKELLFTGDRIRPATAVELGMANRVVPAEDLMDEAMTLACRIAAQPRTALLETKRAVQLGVERALVGIVEVAAKAELHSMGLDDHRAKVAEMLERGTKGR